MPPHTHQDAHDLGLHHDLLTMAAQLRRRQALGLMMGASATALLAACGGGSSGNSGAATTTTTTTTTTTGGGIGNAGACVGYSTDTNGPYPSDGSNNVAGQVSNVLVQSGVVRSDIRTSFAGLNGTATGVPLTLNITLQNSNNNCASLEGAAIYIWHCTSVGNYSLYENPVTQQNFLRGVQVADASGRVSFTTIFPGCYAGRYPHIHLEVFRTLALATNRNNTSLVSQFALPRTDCQAVYTGSTLYGNSANNLNGVQLSTDMIFASDTAAQLAAETITLSGSVAAGYTGTVTVGVPLS
jgi:protocatechuate 3,4-dioxygenase beta subunit